MAVGLSWLPKNTHWAASIEGISPLPSEAARWAALVGCAKTNLDFVQTGKLDRLAQRLHGAGMLDIGQVNPVRLALLGSSTVRHLIAGIRVAGLRHGMWIEVYEPDYGQYLQDLMDERSALHRFQPDFVCFALDARHLAETSGDSAEAAVDLLRNCWSLARNAFRCTVIQQTTLPVFPDLMGSNEHRMANSPQAFVRVLNRLLESAADGDGAHLLTIDKYAAADGFRQWHDPALWHRSKQEVHPAISHMFGEYLARIIAAQRGRSSKCLVLDLDNTLWGGVIGDDGLNGIVLGHGTAAGEAHTAFQQYVKRMKERGILLAVCSKNDASNALAPFEQHSDMILKRSDIACFVANWDDKPANLRHIAATLNIGLDSLVFVDDNPFERELVRRELPEVEVPELPEDPAFYIECIAGAGYFEALTLSAADRERADQYLANAEREELRQSSTDLQGYLARLNMELLWRPFEQANLQRIVQLINKTNQFNLTTRRYNDAEVRSMMGDPGILTWEIRLKDRFGDNGTIALIIAKRNANNELELDTWLMSCRVLGRQVEHACLNLIVEGAKSAGADRILGHYIPTAKNKMVSDLYPRLGFESADTGLSGGPSRWMLDVGTFTAPAHSIAVLEEVHAAG